MNEKTAWKNELYNLIKRFDKPIFTLADVYAFEPELREKFTDNHRVKAKIRQTLQVIRDEGFLEFVDNRGTYRKIFGSPEEKKIIREIKARFKDRDFRVNDKWSNQKVRIGISYFRREVLRNFDYCCCVCNFDIEPLLDASHIISWSKDPVNRLNPANGLSLCKIHHRAFDIGLLKIDSDLVVKIADAVRMSSNESVQNMLAKHDGHHIVNPKKYYNILDFIKTTKEI